MPWLWVDASQSSGGAPLQSGQNAAHTGIDFNKNNKKKICQPCHNKCKPYGRSRFSSQVLHHLQPGANS